MIIVARTPAFALIMSVNPKKRAKHMFDTCDLHTVEDRVYAGSAFKLNRKVRSTSTPFEPHSYNSACFPKNEVAK